MASSAPVTDLAEFCEFVIASLFEIAPTSSGLHQQREGIDTPPYTPPLDGPSASKQPPILLEFIAYALYRTRLPTCIVHQSLLLLSHLKQRYPAARGTSSSPHRLFLSSLMLSAKISMDDTYSNKSWAIVGSNFFPLREVNQMERELFAFLGWNVVTQKDELDSFVASAEASFRNAKTAKRSERAKRRRAEEDEAKEHRHRQATNAARALLRPHTYRHQQGVAAAASSHSRSSSSSVSPSRLSTELQTQASLSSMQPSPIASTSYAVSSPSCSVPGYPATASTAPQHAPFASSSRVSASPPSASCSSQPQSSFSSPHPAVHRRTHSHSAHVMHPSHAVMRSMATSAASTPSTSSLASSRMSSAFPSASHSPTSPPSAPLSAGPQTPDTDCHSNRLYHHHAAAAAAAVAVHQSCDAVAGADFPEADAYLNKQKRSPLSGSTAYLGNISKDAMHMQQPTIVSPYNVIA